MKKEAAGESIFFSEWLAKNRLAEQLSIGAVCDSRCIFCSNYLNPFPIRNGIFRDIEDIKHQLSLMPQHGEPIRMSDSLPGRIAEGEAFLHPEFFKILELIRRKFLANVLCFTTNGLMLDESFLKQLSGFRPIEITLSLHSTRPELLARILKKSGEDALRAIHSLELIKKYRLDLIGAVVALPKICGWDDIELTYAELVSHQARKMLLWWPGYTGRTPAEILKEIECPMEEFMDFVERMKAQHNICLEAFPDMKIPLDVPVNKIMAHTLQGNFKNNFGPFRRVLWLTSEAAFTRLEKIVKEKAGSLPNLHCVVPVKNNTYGGNIIVAGLLMVNDYLMAAKQAIERWPDTELILLPIASFDNLYRDLLKIPAFKISDELKRNVWLVHVNGNIDPLLSGVFVKTGIQNQGNA